MKKKNLSTGKKFLIITLFSISLIFFGIFLGFFIKFLYLGFINNDIDKIDMSLMALVVSFIVGLVFIKTLISMLKFYDRNKKDKTKKWYIDKVIFSLIAVWIVISVVLFSFYGAGFTSAASGCGGCRLPGTPQKSAGTRAFHKGSWHKFGLRDRSRPRQEFPSLPQCLTARFSYRGPCGA